MFLPQWTSPVVASFFTTNLQELDWPLHLAVQGSQPEAVRLLLNNGAIVNAINGKRQTPLQIAVATGHAGIVSMLLAAGADTTPLVDIDADAAAHVNIPAAVVESLRTSRGEPAGAASSGWLPM